VSVEEAVQPCQVGVCKVDDSVSCSYFWDWDGMMLETERVGDLFAAHVSHEDSNATIVIHGMH
jgi:hypothetical protein